MSVALYVVEAQPGQQFVCGLAGERGRLVQLGTAGRAVVGLQGVDAVEAELSAAAAVAPYPSSVQEVPLVGLSG
ncbi:hypothetical protein [Streptomyces sp. NPDC050416]|uniref:hypothetical protein n=1 Tax=Streptomyces sp. NPDC050416 TaxID=3365611 RepID=UPI0037AF0444